MIPEKYRILMNNEIDGVNTPADREELDLYLADQPEARRYFEELKIFLGAIEELSCQPLPVDLHGRIMRAVGTKRSKGHESWQEFIFGRLRMGYALSAAIGVMAGFLLHILIPVDGMGRDLTALELFRGTNTTELVSGWVAATPLDLPGDDVGGQIFTYRQDDQILVRVNLRGSREVKLAFSFKDKAHLQGIHYGANEGFQTTAGGNTLELVGQGACRCDFLIAGLGKTGLDAQSGVMVEWDAGPDGGAPLRHMITFP